MTTFFILVLALVAVGFGVFFGYEAYKAQDELELGTLFVER
nr:MAG TPA: hypothetical protein [Caudoviricetes sp.]